MASSKDASAPTPFVPLEANPDVLTNLLHRLGVRENLGMSDVYSLEDPGLLAMVPRPVHALLLVFPISAAYESHRLAEDAIAADYAGSGDGEPVIWFKQTISNACGLVALLHGACNGEVKSYIKQDSVLAQFLAEAIPLAPPARAQLIERSGALASAHAEAAQGGDTSAPPATDSVDLHYVCFTKGADGKTLWELDGRRKGPIALGQLEPDEDVLSARALTLGPQAFLKRESNDLRFSCIALAAADGAGGVRTG